MEKCPIERCVRYSEVSLYFVFLRFVRLNFSFTVVKLCQYNLLPADPRGHCKVKNYGRGGWLDSLGSGILVGKRYVGVLQKY